MRGKQSSVLPAAQLKVLVAIYEISLCGAAPSQKGLRAFLKGEPTAEAFEGCLLFGGYSSMNPKRLGSLLGILKKLGYVDSSFEQGDEFYYLFPDARKIAENYLSKDHKIRKGKEPTPLFIRLDR